MLCVSVCGWGVDAPSFVLQGPPRLCCTWLHAHGMPLLSWCGVRCMMHTSAHYPYMCFLQVPTAFFFYLITACCFLNWSALLTSSQLLVCWSCLGQVAAPLWCGPHM